MKAPKFDLGQTVWLKCRIAGITAQYGGWEYCLELPTPLEQKTDWVSESFVAVQTLLEKPI